MLSFDQLAVQQLQWDGPVGEITRHTPVSQTFTATEDRLYRIEILPHTYHRSNHATLWFKLREGVPNGSGMGKVPSPVRSVGPLNTSILVDQEWFSFEFEPITHSRGKVYTFSLESEDSCTGNAISLMADRTLGRWMTVGGEQQPGSLAFKGVRLAYPDIQRNFDDFRNNLRERRQVVSHTPLMIRLEVSQVCNMRCIMCVSGQRAIDRPRGEKDFMDLAVFKSIAGVLPRAVELNPFGLGEPFLNPDYLEILTLARRLNPHLNVFTSTNGMLFDEETARRVVGGQLINRLQFSIDGTCRGTYEQVRPGGDYARVISNLKSLLKVRNSDSGQMPEVWTMMLVMKQTVDQIADYARQMADLGVDVVLLDTVKGESAGDLAVDDTDSLQRIADQLEKARELLQGRQTVVGGPLPLELPELIARQKVRCAHPETHTGMGAGAPAGHMETIAGPLACQLPWESLMLTADGQIRVCCISFKPMGSPAEQGFSAVWNGPAYRRFRRDVSSGKLNTCCRRCLAENVSRPDQTVFPVYLERSMESTGRTPEEPGNEGPSGSNPGPGFCSMSQTEEGFQLRDTGRTLIGPDGIGLPILPRRVEGYLGTFRVKPESISISGWAGDIRNSRLVEEVAVFLDDRFLHSCPTWIERRDVVQAYDDPSLLNSGFIFDLPARLLNRSPVSRLRFIAITGESASDLYTITEFDKHWPATYCAIGPPARAHRSERRPGRLRGILQRLPLFKGKES